MTAPTYRPLEPDRDMDVVARILSLAFGGNADDTRSWVDSAKDHVRVLGDGATIHGALALYPMAHWFGGRSVSARGVAGVGVSPESRGRGVGTRLMHAAVQEIHDEGTALSALYPAVQSLYRRAGYERAGHLYLADLRLREVAPVDRSLTLRPATADDEPALEALEAARARVNDGNVDRSDIMWSRARRPHGKPTEAHVVEEDGALTGYLRVRHLTVDGKRWLSVPDVAASTPGAARRILAFLADHAQQIETARLFHAPSCPIQSAADSLCFRVKVGDVWMLRITHLENALAARGYPPGLTAEVHLDVKDDLCPANAGRWRLHVADGHGTVERGGEGRVALHVRDLAPIYSGYQHPLVARTARRVSGSDDDLRTMGAVFAGTGPWMQDAF